MLHNKDLVILKKILHEIEYLDSIIITDCFEDFDKDEKLKRATAMTLINIGELANHLSKDFRETRKDFPIRGMIDLRNISAHGYHSLQFGDVWATIKTSIPDLKTKIELVLTKV